MTNKTFLILLLFGVSYTAYNAAAVSENFAISTTIDHEITLGNFRAASADANLDVTGDLALGTITINPIYQTGSFMPDTNGGIYIVEGTEQKSGGVISVSGGHTGRIRVNLPDPYIPQDYIFITPDPLVVDVLSINTFMIWNVEDNIYAIMPDEVSYSSLPRAKNYSGSVTITYRAD
ncbi:MAG: hypothetical protein IJ689_06760 [Alphaproteobacteria bacterium]|nr:hypothetical protein [Alphaproteobacteria bacterium]